MKQTRVVKIMVDMYMRSLSTRYIFNSRAITLRVERKLTRRDEIVARIISDDPLPLRPTSRSSRSQKVIEMNPRDVFRQVMLVHETVAAHFADELWLLPALDALMLAERFFPLVRLAAGIARVSFVV